MIDVMAMAPGPWDMDWAATGCGCPIPVGMILPLGGLDDVSLIDRYDPGGREVVPAGSSCLLGLVTRSIETEGALTVFPSVGSTSQLFGTLSDSPRHGIRTWGLGCGWPHGA